MAKIRVTADNEFESIRSFGSQNDVINFPDLACSRVYFLTLSSEGRL